MTSQRETSIQTAGRGGTRIPSMPASPGNRVPVHPYTGLNDGSRQAPVASKSTVWPANCRGSPAPWRVKIYEAYFPNDLIFRGPHDVYSVYRFPSRCLKNFTLHRPLAVVVSMWCVLICTSMGMQHAACAKYVCSLTRTSTLFG